MNTREHSALLPKELKDGVLFDRRLTHAGARVAGMILDRLHSLNVEAAEISYAEIESAVHVKRSAIKSACAQLVGLGYFTIRYHPGQASLFSLPAISEVIGTTKAQAA